MNKELRPNIAQSRGPRHFLFLQGLATPFFRRLGRALGRRGHRVTRVNLNAGDWMFWGFAGMNFRGRVAEWPNFIRNLVIERGVTDLVLFGDGRVYHAQAISIAGEFDLEVHVFEEGYVRPYWITLERGGANANSRLPRAREDILAAPREPVPPAIPYASGLRNRVLWDITYQLATMLLSPLYWSYRRHRPFHPLVEAGGWVRRFLTSWSRSARSQQNLAAVLASGQPFYLVPLQLDSDFQIRLHSPFAHIGEMMELVVASFARNAPAHSQLLFKVHPLDNGLVDRDAQLARIADLHGVTARTALVYGGELEHLIERSTGVVVINSTVGLAALFHRNGYPVKVLGNAYYDIPGLTFEGSLDDFWRLPAPPERELIEAFKNLVLSRTQINGSFFDQAAFASTVEGAVAHLCRTHETSPLRVAVR